MKRHGFLFVFSLLLALVLAVPVPGAAKEKVLFTPGWIFQGRDLPWFTAIEKGYYAAEGLEVTVFPGSGGGDAIKMLRSGGVDIANIDTGTFLQGRAQGFAMKSVAAVYYTPAFLMAAHEGSGIRTLKDLEGRTLCAARTDSTWMNFPIVAEKQGIDLKKIKVLQFSVPARDPAFLAGQCEAATGFTTSLPMLLVTAEKQGKKILYFPLAKFGLDIYGMGMIATEKMMKERPEAIRGFVRASMRGTAYAISHPEEAMGYLLKVSPTLGRAVHRAVWDVMVDHLLVSEVKEHGLGSMSEKKWKDTRDALLRSQAAAEPVMKSGSARAKLSAGDLYTNDFLPRPPIFPGKPGPRVFPSIFSSQGAQ